MQRQKRCGSPTLHPRFMTRTLFFWIESNRTFQPILWLETYSFLLSKRHRVRELLSSLGRERKPNHRRLETKFTSWFRFEEQDACQRVGRVLLRKDATCRFRRRFQKWNKNNKSRSQRNLRFHPRVGIAFWIHLRWIRSLADYVRFVRVPRR